MSRLKRKFRSDIEIKGKGGLHDAFDDMIKTLWRINDDEYDYICEQATNDELDLLLLQDTTIDIIKNSMIMVDGFLIKYNQSK